MLFRPFDTNNAIHQSTLGLSPPAKKCDKSPSKVPMNADLLFRADQQDSESKGFKLDLQTIVSGQDQQQQRPNTNSDWQTDLRSQIASFEQSFAERKAALLSQLENLSSEGERKSKVDAFLGEMDRRSVEVLQSQSYARHQVLNTKPSKMGATSPLKVTSSFGSPTKKSSPMKENSPLKKMGSLRKQSRLVEQENQQSPPKQGLSPQKQARAKLFGKKSLTEDEYMLRSFVEGPQKASPLKKQMRLFESPESPQKNVADLKQAASKAPTLFAVVEPPKTVFGQMTQMKATNLLKSRKTCEKKQLNITDVATVDQKIISFGKFISGQNLGNELVVTNKTDKEQTFTLSIDDVSERFPETANQLLAPFCPEDLPFKTSAEEHKKAVNSQKKFNCWSIENPANRTLQKTFVFTLAPHDKRDFVIVLQTPMAASRSNLLAKLVLSKVLDEADQKAMVEKRIRNSDSTIQKHRLVVNQSMDVLLCGRLENPVLTCPKAISCPSAAGSPVVIPIVAKLGLDVQKFKLPFKAAHATTQETDFEFIFIKSVQPEPTEFGESLEEKQFDVFSCMTFFCLPAVLKVGHEAASLLTVQLQINHDKIKRLPAHLLQMQMTKLLVARIKNTKLIQSFYLTINLVE